MLGAGPAAVRTKSGPVSQSLERIEIGYVRRPTVGKKSRLESTRYGQALDRDRAIFCNVKRNQLR